MKLLIISINILFFTSLPILLQPDRWEDTKITRSKIEVPGIKYPTDVAMLDNTLYILKDETIVEWDIISKKTLSTEQVTSNTVLGTDNNSLFICSWENFEIQNKDEFATVIYWRKHGAESQEYWLNKTVKPISCQSDKIIAMNAYPILQEQYYEISTKTGKLKRIEFNEEPVVLRNKHIKVKDDGVIIVEQEAFNTLAQRLSKFFLTKN